MNRAQPGDYIRIDSYCGSERALCTDVYGNRAIAMIRPVSGGVVWALVDRHRNDHGLHWPYEYYGQLGYCAAYRVLRRDLGAVDLMRVSAGEKRAS